MSGAVMGLNRDRLRCPKRWPSATASVAFEHSLGMPQSQRSTPDRAQVWRLNGQTLCTRSAGWARAICS